MRKHARRNLGLLAYRRALLTTIVASIAGLSTTTHAAQLDVIATFDNSANVPLSNLVSIGDSLYGTTIGGGTKNGGTLFKIGPDGKRTTIYNFGAAKSGLYPTGNLLLNDNAIYGVTSSGGAKGKGTIYKITPDGTATVLYSFQGGNVDGTGPSAGLTLLDGVLYGTAGFGAGNGCGGFGCGAVYRINPDGTGYKQIYAFQPDGADGSFPEATLLALDGVLYGTTRNGGVYENGTIFSVTVDGHETVLRSFGESASSSKTPIGGLVSFNKALYGTTSAGGTFNKGTLFSLNKGGANYKILHSFGAPGAGQAPQGDFTKFDKKLFGATAYGGENNNGILYTVDLDNKVTPVERFTGQPGPSHPNGALLRIGKSLYGTSSNGGPGPDDCRNGGCGTAFKFTP